MSDPVEDEEYRCFEQFLGRKWSKFIVKFKLPILLAFAGLFVGAAVIGSQIEAQSEEEKWFPDDHFMTKSQTYAAEFSASETDALVQILITMGIAGVDRDGTSKWDPKEYGTVVWDPNFDISPVSVQNFLYDVCNNTKYYHLTYGPHLVTCPIEGFKAYLESVNDTFPYNFSTNPDEQREEFGEVYNDYLNSRFGAPAKSNSLTFAELNPATDSYVVRFYAMFIYTDLSWNDGSGKSLDSRSSWDSLVDQFENECPERKCGAVRNVGLRWCWLETRDAFVQSAVQGILIAMPLAFAILLIATQNWIISIFAVLDIIGIMLCELAIMKLQGWALGVAECVAIVIIIGFSVDYVVHLANAYLECTARDRESRLSFALLTMGISVVSGAVTTFGAGFFLIFPPMVFFVKMGILMITTVTMSILWAMFFFTAICAMIGPQGKAGNLTRYFRKCGCGKKRDFDDDDNGEVEMRKKKKRNAADNYKDFDEDAHRRRISQMKIG